jgi:hypothetical protein
MDVLNQAAAKNKTPSNGVKSSAPLGIPMISLCPLENMRPTDGLCPRSKTKGTEKGVTLS